MKTKKLLRLVVLAMMVALGVVISPLLRIEGMCPMAHFINIVCAVLLGPWESLLCAVLIGIIRMATMGIPPIALTGAVFGAFLSGVLYRTSKGNLLMAILGEVVGTGIIGAILSYPVMTVFWGKEGLSWFFYVPSFICGTLIGGSVAYVFLKKLAANGALSKFQEKLGTSTYRYQAGAFEDSCLIAAVGVIGYLVVKVLHILLNIQAVWLNWLAYITLTVFILWSVVYYIFRKRSEQSGIEYHKKH